MTSIIDHYVDQHAAARADLAGAGLDWLQSERDDALRQFRDNGFPGPRDEDWRYMPLRGITSGLFSVSVAQSSSEQLDLTPFAIAELDSIRLVFIDGHFSSDLSDRVADAATFAGSLKDALHQGDQLIDAIAGVKPRRLDGNRTDEGFAALNVAFSADGYVINVAQGKVLDRPIEVLCISTGESSAAQPRNVIRLDRDSKASVIERHVALPDIKSLINSTCAIELAQNAKLNYVLVQELESSSSQVTTTRAVQAAHSNLSCFTASLGGGLLRNNLRVRLEGEGAHCDMLGLYNIAGKQHVDNHTTVVHAAPHCTSRELYKGVLDQRSRAVFHGRIKVEQDAQKTDATQANNNLLLSANAEVDTKPQLEIYADDVKCAHGATVGQLDETALFYLRSRGIDAESARSLMTFAFVNEVLSEIEIAPLCAYLESMLARRLIDEDLFDETLVSS